MKDMEEKKNHTYPDFIAVRSEKLSKSGDVRYIIINRNTREVADDGHGHGYRTPEAAHRSFAYKRKFGERPRQRGAGERPPYPVSPFVQEASATVKSMQDKGCRRPIPPRSHRHPKEVSQENTTPPPDL